jgi:hypothetical protein
VPPPCQGRPLKMALPHEEDPPPDEVPTPRRQRSLLPDKDTP